MLQREDEDGDANDEEEVDGLPGVNSYCFVSGGLVVLWYGCWIYNSVVVRAHVVSSLSSINWYQRKLHLRQPHQAMH